MKARYYGTEHFANAQARAVSNILGLYISVEHNDKGYYLSAKYAQGLTPSS